MQSSSFQDRDTSLASFLVARQLTRQCIENLADFGTQLGRFSQITNKTTPALFFASSNFIVLNIFFIILMRLILLKSSWNMTLHRGFVSISPNS